MSVIRTCVRLATVAALRDKTWAGMRVHDSSNLPIDQSIVQEPMPYVGVYTDDDEHEGEGMEISGAARKLQLIVEFGVAGPVEATTGGSGPSISVPVTTDEGFELIVDAVEKQILFALSKDSTSEWGKIWRSFCLSIDAMLSRRGASGVAGVRWAARQLVFTLSVIEDPVAGYVPPASHPVQRFLVAAQAAPEEYGMTNAIPVVLSMITSDEVPDWRVAQNWLGGTTLGIKALGLGPVGFPSTSDDEPTVTQVDVPQQTSEQTVDTTYMDRDDGNL